MASVTQAGGAPQQAGETTEVSTVTPAARTASSSGSDSTVAAGRRVWLWLSVASAATLLVVGAFLGWRERHAAPRLAIEQRVTSNPPDAPVTAPSYHLTESTLPIPIPPVFTYDISPLAKRARCSCPHTPMRLRQVGFRQVGFPTARTC